jgi:hypothetical protein
MPANQPRDYLPAQALADCLTTATDPALDGMIVGMRDTITGLVAGAGIRLIDPQRVWLTPGAAIPLIFAARTDDAVVCRCSPAELTTREFPSDIRSRATVWR